MIGPSEAVFLYNLTFSKSLSPNNYRSSAVLTVNSRLYLPHWRFPEISRNVVVVEVLLYVHRSRKFIRDGSPERPPRLSHSSWDLISRNVFNPSWPISLKKKFFRILWLLHSLKQSSREAWNNWVQHKLYEATRQTCRWSCIKAQDVKLLW